MGKMPLLEICPLSFCAFEEGVGQKAWPRPLLDRMGRRVEGHGVGVDKRDGRPDTEMDKLQVGRQVEAGPLWHLLQRWVGLEAWA